MIPAESSIVHIPLDEPIGRASPRRCGVDESDLVSMREQENIFSRKISKKEEKEQLVCEALLLFGRKVCSLFCFVLLSPMGLFVVMTLIVAPVLNARTCVMWIDTCV